MKSRFPSGTVRVCISRARAWVVIIAACAASFACGAPPEEILHCRDLLPAEQVRFPDLATIVAGRGGKGCAGCHNTASPVFGYNFEGPGVAYDALSNKPEIIYAQLASKAMPQRNTSWDVSSWSPDDLRIFRTWYCNGAIYED